MKETKETNKCKTSHMQNHAKQRRFLESLKKTFWHDETIRHDQTHSHKQIVETALAGCMQVVLNRMRRIHQFVDAKWIQMDQGFSLLWCPSKSWQMQCNFIGAFWARSLSEAGLAISPFSTETSLAQKKSWQRVSPVISILAAHNGPPWSTSRL